MKIEKVNDHQIRCTLTKADLADRELKISELAYGTEKAKNLFRDMGSLRTDTWEKLLEQMEEAGVGFYLNGRRATPKDIIDKCSLREKAVYMPDFVMDDEGRLKEVRYDEVTKW